MVSAHLSAWAGVTLRVGVYSPEWFLYTLVHGLRLFSESGLLAPEWFLHTGKLRAALLGAPGAFFLLVNLNSLYLFLNIYYFRLLGIRGFMCSWGVTSKGALPADAFPPNTHT